MYRVFLGSTGRDLQAYRDAIRDVIHRLDGFEHIRSVDRGTRKKVTAKTDRTKLRQSDLFIGLVGHALSDKAPGEAESLAEREYDLAVDTDRPRLVFRAPDDFTGPANLRQSDEDFARQEAFRARIENECTAATFSCPARLASEITAALVRWQQEREGQTPAPPLDDGPTGEPYRGLEAFGKADAAWFFGRDELTEQVWLDFLRLHASPTKGDTPVRLLGILGPSGTGKSSLVQAGLLARADQAPLPGRPAPTTIMVTPDARPLRSLAEALAQAVNDERRATEFEQALRATNHDGLRLIAEDSLGLAQAGLILVLDRFERLHGLCGDPAERDLFIETVLAAAGDPGECVSVIVTLRSDCLAAANRHARLGQLLAAQHVVVPALARDELHHAIEAPAQRAGQSIDAATAIRLVEDALDHTTPLPPLQFLLRCIWQRMAEGDTAADALDALGGVGAALDREAERLYAELSEDQQAIAECAFLAMVRPSETGPDLPQTIMLDQIDGTSPDAVEAVLQVFAQPESRLVTCAATSDGRTTATLAHEAILQHWRRLRAWCEARAGQPENDATQRLVDEALAWRTRFLVRRAEEQTRAGDPLTGMRLALEALSKNAAAPEEAKTALRHAVFRHQTPLALLPHEHRVTSAAFSPDGEIVVTATVDRVVRLWHASDGRPLAILQGHEDRILSTALSPDGRQIVTTSEDRTARLWDVASGQLLAVLEGHGDWVLHAAFSPDGRHIVTGSDDCTARLWDAASGELLAVLEGHDDGIPYAGFSPGGERILTASDDTTARLWEARSATPVAALRGHRESVRSASFSPDGATVVTASLDRTARFWEAEAGKAIATLNGHAGRVRSAAFSPDGSKIVTASDDATARLWEADSCRQIGTLAGHAEAIFSATFSPRGQAIVTASADRTARLWDAGSGRPLATLNGHTDRVRSARFSPNGSKIVTASHDRTARIWRALPTTQDLVAYVEEVVPEPLTSEERDRLLFGSD